MADNRSILEESEIVRRTAPPGGLTGRFAVPDGWVAVVTRSGAFHRLAEPGAHSLGLFHSRRDFQHVLVNVGRKTLLVAAAYPFTASTEQSLMNIDIDLEL